MERLITQYPNLKPISEFKKGFLSEVWHECHLLAVIGPLLVSKLVLLVVSEST